MPAPQNRGHLVVQRMASGHRIDDEHHDVGFRGGGLGLAPGGRPKRVAVDGVGFRIDSGRIDEAERTAAPVADRVQAVARNAGGVFDDR